jgi:hypothetical protein
MPIKCAKSVVGLGLETVQQYGSDGIGLTSAVLHDVYGPFGRSEQILTFG